LSNPVNRQTDTGENITSLEEVIMISRYIKQTLLLI